MSVRPSCLVTHEAGGNRSQQAGQITGQAAEGMSLSDKGIVIAISPCIRIAIKTLEYSIQVCEATFMPNKWESPG